MEPCYCIATLLTGIALVLGSENKRSPEFGYDGDMGPQHWSDKFGTCSGKFQSPIDIEEHLVVQVRLPPLKFKNFRAPPASSTLSNNGHTVMMQLNTTKMPQVSGGPLPGEYSFAQMHFHWGANDSMGSEDTINNHTFPLELHMVFFKSEYGSMGMATNYKDGLAVLAVFYEVYGEDNPVYSEIVENLPSVVSPEANVSLDDQIPLDAFLPHVRHLYFTYNGSLTTPPCSEIVTWLDFKQPILLSHKQVNTFRMLKSDRGDLTHNYRPVQPLSGRLISFNVADVEPESGASTLPRISALQAATLATLVALVLFEL